MCNDSLLSPFRILDLTDEKGLLCGKILGDMGADVIKIEKPGGDSARNIGPFYHDMVDPECSLYWLAYNTSKRSVTANLETEDGQDVFKKLVRTADCIIESFPVGYMGRLGLGWEEINRLNPAIILTSITGFGQTGPYTNYKICDLTAQALSGMMDNCGELGGRPVVFGGPQSRQAYLQAGAQAAVGTMIALFHRERTGKGQHVDVSILESIAWAGAMPWFLLEWELEGHVVKRQGNRAVRDYLSMKTQFPCMDGYVSTRIFLGQLGHFTRCVVDWMDEEGMAEDLGTLDWNQLDLLRITQNHVDRWETVLARFLSRHTKAEFQEQAAKRGLLVFPVSEPCELLDDPQLKHRQFFTPINLSFVESPLLFPGSAYHSTCNPPRILRRPPHIGEHNQLIDEIEFNNPDRESNQTQRFWKLSNIDPMTQIKGALSGIKVVEVGWVIMGPLSGKLLGDFGAEVVKVETRSRPDISRVGGPFAGGKPGINKSGYFSSLNGSKYDMTLNLSCPEGIEILKRLVTWCDVLIENFRPGQFSKWGLSYHEVQKFKPEIIMISLSNQGQTGPLAPQPGFGTFFQGAVGFNHLTGWPDKEPVCPNSPYPDWTGAWYALVAIIGALIYRQRTGKGQYIDLSQLETNAHFLAPAILDFQANRRKQERVGNRLAEAAPHGVYRCKGDDRWVAIGIFTDEEWQILCHVLGGIELAKDERFEKMENRKKNEDELDKIIEKWTSQHFADEVMVKMQEAGISAGMVQSTRDISQDKHLKERGFFEVLDHPEMGPCPYARASFVLSETPPRMRRAPLLGEHTEYVCREFLQMSEDEFSQLLSKGVFK